MYGRCPGCTVGEKLKNLQVLRHVVAARRERVRGDRRREVYGSRRQAQSRKEP